jgi:hypothetical protein
VQPINLKSKNVVFIQIRREIQEIAAMNDFIAEECIDERLSRLRPLSTFLPVLPVAICLMTLKMLSGGMGNHAVKSDVYSYLDVYISLTPSWKAVD